MFKRTGVLSAIAAGMVLSTTPMFAQRPHVDVRELQSDVDSVRPVAFTRLIQRGKADHIPVCSAQASASMAEGLIAALVKENSIIYGRSMVSETETEYHAELIGCVAALKNRKAINPLLDAIDTGGGAINGLVLLGDAAVPDVANLVRSRSVRTAARTSAAYALGQFVAPRAPIGLSAASRAIIRNTLLAALNDGYPYVRAFAVDGLVPFDDAEVRNAVGRLASTDSGFRIGKEANRSYPARDAARIWLRKDSLKLRKPPL